MRQDLNNLKHGLIVDDEKSEGMSKSHIPGVELARTQLARQIL
jgi:hypothetical protein